MRTFVDIGSHEGQTLQEVLRPRWDFDEVHAIEPMPKQMTYLRSTYERDERVVLHEMALHDHDGWLVMYGTNQELEASIYEHKNDVDANVHTVVRCEDAASFFSKLAGQVIVNLNAEGAELPILDRLLETGAIGRISALLVDFDIRKVSPQHREEERLRAALDASGLNWTCEYPPGETHQEMVGRWLQTFL